MAKIIIPEFYVTDKKSIDESVKGAHYFDNDIAAKHPDRGNLTDSEYQVIIAQKNAQIDALQTEKNALQTELQALTFVSIETEAQSTISIVEHTTQEAPDSLVYGTVVDISFTPNTGYVITNVSINGTNIPTEEITTGVTAFTVTQNLTIVVTTAVEV